MNSKISEKGGGEAAEVGKGKKRNGKFISFFFFFVLCNYQLSLFANITEHLSDIQKKNSQTKVLTYKKKKKKN